MLLGYDEKLSKFQQHIGKRGEVDKINKIDVTPGVFWIDIPKANLQILCGAPADSVKHLMRIGLIHTHEVQGMKWETGPNAILLSDSAMQNGSFCNMAEFPILQMLYRQGMILPDHPNNKGAKPLIIGCAKQVSAQMSYIFRGNYGLANAEEMIEAGVDEATAKELMRMKLRFAFGKIRDPDELLDSIVVNDKRVLLRDEAWIERICHNIYRIGFKDESVEVDLNLDPTTHYHAPYNLGYYDIEREYFGIVHSGQGDGWDINRPSMSSILMFQGRIFLIDAGPNIESILMALGIGTGEVEGIFHTHAHDDHFAGLPTLMRADHKVKYFAAPEVRASVAKKLCALLGLQEQNFADFFDIVDLKVGEYNDIEGLEVMPITSPHPVETTIFFFRTLWEGGYRSYGHFADIVSMKALENMITDDPSAAGISKEFAQSVKNYYHTKLDIKKLDVGGGMIHGEAEDFRYDRSERLILSHTSNGLTTQQKEIGSGASFGTVDVIIHAKQTYVWRYAHDFLCAYFSVPHHELRPLLNSDIVHFNPETILIREGEMKNSIYLLLTGNVELIPPKGRRVVMLSAGALIGEVSGLVGLPCGETYRAVGFVQALRIPSDLYLAFVQRNELYDQIEELKDSRNFLEKSWIFGEEISYPIQNRIAEAMEHEKFSVNTEISVAGGHYLYLIQEGTVELKYKNNLHMELSEGDFFGEEGSIFSAQSTTKAICKTAVKLLKIPCQVLHGIPIVRLKILETYQRRLNGALH